MKRLARIREARRGEDEIDAGGQLRVAAVTTGV